MLGVFALQVSVCVGVCLCASCCFFVSFFFTVLPSETFLSHCVCILNTMTIKTLYLILFYSINRIQNTATFEVSGCNLTSDVLDGVHKITSSSQN